MNNEKANTMNKQETVTGQEACPLDAFVIAQREALEALREMPDDCCDIFTDPPYNVGKDYGVWDDSMPDQEYERWISDVLTECKRVAVNMVVYVPKKWNLLYWNVLGDSFQEIILPFRPAGAIRYGYSNQFNKLLTNARPKREKPVLNVWDNMQQPGLGFFFREDTLGNPGYTSEAITRRALEQLLSHEFIYDPFMGVGTTAVAAEKAGKKWAGTELNPEFIEKAWTRIHEYRNQLELAL